MDMSANFETAVHYFEQSRFDRCLKTCRKIIGADPEFVDAYLLGARAAQAGGLSFQEDAADSRPLVNFLPVSYFGLLIPRNKTGFSLQCTPTRIHPT